MDDLQARVEALEAKNAALVEVICELVLRLRDTDFDARGFTTNLSGMAFQLREQGRHAVATEVGNWNDRLLHATRR